MKIYCKIIFCFFFLLDIAFSQSAIISTEKTNYFVGDYINITIKVSTVTGMNVITPTLDSLGNFEVISYNGVETEAQGTSQITKYKYTISCYKNGEFYIPQQRIFVQRKSGDLQTLNTNPIKLQIDLVPVDMNGDIRDIKPPIEVPFPYLTFSIILCSIILLVLVAYFGWKYYKKKYLKPNVVAVEKTPYQIALEHLLELKGSELWQKGEYKEFHSRITDIIRTFLEKETKVMALEKTTSEIIEELNCKNIDSMLIENAREFFATADLVKFAKFTPDEHINDRMFVLAGNLLENFYKMAKNNDTL